MLEEWKGIEDYFKLKDESIKRYSNGKRIVVNIGDKIKKVTLKVTKPYFRKNERY